MRKCNFCSTENANEAQYCRGCGRPMGEPAPGPDPFAASTEVWQEPAPSMMDAAAPPSGYAGGGHRGDASSAGGRSVPTSKGSPSFDLGSSAPPPPAPMSGTLAGTVVGKSTADVFQQHRRVGPDPNAVTSVEQMGSSGGVPSGAFSSGGAFGGPASGASIDAPPPPPPGGSPAAAFGAAPAGSGAFGSGGFGAPEPSRATPAAQREPSGQQLSPHDPSASVPAPSLPKKQGGGPKSGGGMGWFAGGCLLTLLLGGAGGGYYVWTVMDGMDGEEVATNLPSDGDEPVDQPPDQPPPDQPTEQGNTAPVDSPPDVPEGADTPSENTDEPPTDGIGEPPEGTEESPAETAEEPPPEDPEEPPVDETQVTPVEDPEESPPVVEEPDPELRPTERLDHEPGDVWTRRARAALRGAGQSCFRRHGGGGSVTVLVFVQPNGQVGYTRVTSNSAGSRVGECISGALVGRTVPAPPQGPRGRGGINFNMTFRP